MAEPAQHQQPTAYTAEGEAIAPEDTAAAVREGRGFFQKGAKVFAKNHLGDFVTVAPEAAGKAGYTVLTPAEIADARRKIDAESGVGMAKTAGEGLVRGGTMGLAGLEQFYDSEGRKNAAARAKYNPGIAAGSELAGTLGAATAASILSGGAAAGGAGELTAGRLAAMAGRGATTPFRVASLLGDAAEAGARALGAGEGILGTGARLGARGLVEGAAFGAGHEVGQAALEDVPLTAERLLAGAWDGAKMGGAFGAGLGVLGAGVGKAGRAIVGRMAESGDDMTAATGSFAERTMARQHLDGAKIWNKATSFGDDMARPARIGRKLLDADMPSETGAALKRAGQLADEAVGRMKAVAEAVDQTGVAVRPERILSAVDDQISKLKETPFGDFHTIAKRVESEIAPFRANVEAANARAAAEPMRVRLPDGTVELRARTPEAPMSFSELWDLRKKLDDVVYREGKAQGPAKEALETMRDAFRKELDDTIATAAETSGAPPELLGAWKKATEDYSDFALVKSSLKGLSNRLSKNRSISPSDYGTGTAAGMLMGILSGNPVAGLATSAVTSGVHKLIRERGAGVLAKIADRSGGVAGRMETAAKVAAMVESPKAVALPPAVSMAKQFERYSAALNEANADPAKFAARMASATADLTLRAPELASKVQQTMMADLAYLNSIHPQPASRKGATLTPMAVAPDAYAFNQQRAFVDAAMAIDNPVSVFDSIAHGDLPLDGINALKERRPLLFNDMRQTVIKYTVTRKEELPFSRRMLLGTAFDFPSDWSMLHVGEIQSSLVAGNASGKPNDPTAAPSKVNPDPGGAVAPGMF